MCDLLAQKDILPVAKTIYVTACLSPQSISGLSHAVAMSTNNVRHHLQALALKDWVELRSKGRQVLVLPSAPHKIQHNHAEQLRVRLCMAFYRGEAQMKTLLDTLVVSRNFVDNARPDFLKSPVTQFNLEVDRLYPGVVGFEYDGPQHRHPTLKYGSKSAYGKTRLNDLLKSGLALEANIQLVHVIKAHLTVEGIKGLVPTSMKTWPLVDGPYLRAIRETCADYMKMDTGDEDQMRLARRVSAGIQSG